MSTIIDGYNLIFTCGLEGKKRNPQSIEKSRARLISMVAAKLNERERSGTTIVFDAKRLPIKETAADSTVHGIRILYAVDHDDADSLIEELIQQNSTPKKLVVVSSDHRIQTAATRRKATAIDSDVWWDQLLSAAEIERSEDSQHASDEKQSDIQSLDSTDWTREFGSVNLTNQTDEPAPSRPDSNPSTCNPFPPGYGEDLLD